MKLTGRKRKGREEMQQNEMATAKVLIESILEVFITIKNNENKNKNKNN